MPISITKSKTEIQKLYSYYEAAVQDPKEQVLMIEKISKNHMNRPVKSLREDFCGTGLVSFEWVRSNSDRTAYGLDLDEEALQRAVQIHGKLLDQNEKKRIGFFQKNVMSKTELVDVSLAGNFSYFCFLTRKDMKSYFQSVYQSLKKGGCGIFEIVGGAGLLDPMDEKRKVKKNDLNFTYIWSQSDFDPIKGLGNYAISFHEKNGKKYDRCFEYTWRIWGLNELKDLLHEAGFSELYVYWEQDDENNEPNGEFEIQESAEDSYTWTGYLVGKKV